MNLLTETLLWPEIRDRLDDAVDGGYPEIANWTSFEIACDLIAYCCTFEQYEPEELEPLVKKWKNLNNEKTNVNWKEGF